MKLDQEAGSNRPRVVIIGAGFGGLFAARAMKKLNADLLLVDRHNYHLFQPLLYQVATAGLAPSDVAWPIRSIFSRQTNATVVLGEVYAIDSENQQVLVGDERLAYDYLVLATGARHSYFGHDDWAIHAPGLKSIDDATGIRRKLLMAFEKAEICQNEVERKRLMQFLVVGAGPTGVELAGAIAELAHHTLAKDFHQIDPRSASVILVEGSPRILPAFDESLSEYAGRALEKLHVDVRLNSQVTACDEVGVTINGMKVPAATVLWAAGVAASPVGEWLNTETDRSGRVVVGPDLSIDGKTGIFVIGDTASVKDESGTQVPGIAPAAKQQGRYVAKVIGSQIAGGKPPPPFLYRHAGDLATIGRKSAVIQYRNLKLKGALAWWIWGIAHIYFLIGLPSPLLVSLRWLWGYITYSRGARLITDKNQTR
jgi:NADH dehydrogenase